VAVGYEYIYFFGGDTGNTAQKVEKLIAAINAETNESIKNKLILEKNALQLSHPGFNRHVIQFNTTTNTCFVIDTIPFDAPVTTSVLNWGSDLVLCGGEIRRGVRSPIIQIGKYI